MSERILMPMKFFTRTTDDSERVMMPLNFYPGTMSQSMRPVAKGAKGDTGATGAQGEKGDKGDTGAAGAGVATGGTTGQILQKKSATDYDTEWVDKPNSAVWGSITGTLSAQTDLQTALGGKSTVTMANTGTATDYMHYVTIDGTEHRIPGGVVFVEYESDVTTAYTLYKEGFDVKLTYDSDTYTLMRGTQTTEKSGAIYVTKTKTWFENHATGKVITADSTKRGTTETNVWSEPFNTTIGAAVAGKVATAQGTENEGKILKVNSSGNLELANFYQLVENEAGGDTLTF